MNHEPQHPPKPPQPPAHVRRAAEQLRKAYDLGFITGPADPMAETLAAACILLDAEVIE